MEKTLVLQGCGGVALICETVRDKSKEAIVGRYEGTKWQLMDLVMQSEHLRTCYVSSIKSAISRMYGKI